MKSINVRAPGKLFIAGEYAVVTPGEPAVLVAVDRYLRVSMTSAEHYGTISSDLYDRPVVWRVDSAGELIFDARSDDLVAHTLRLCHEVTKSRGLDPAVMHISITSELAHADGQKYGLGSSAAVTAALVTAVDAFVGLGLDIRQRVLLALCATLNRSPKASGADIAASMVGGWVWYRSPDRDAIATTMRDRGVVAVLAADWVGFELRRLPDPKELSFAVGWTGTPALTDVLVGARNPGAELREQFTSESRLAVSRLREGLEQQDDGIVLDAVQQAHEALAQFDRVTHGGIATAPLRRLRNIAMQHGAVAKVSGAGGGDCGVALAASHEVIPRMKEAWRANGITPLDINIDEAGTVVRAETSGV